MSDEFRELQAEVLLEAYMDEDLSLEAYISEMEELGFKYTRIKSILKKNGVFDEEEWDSIVW